MTAASGSPASRRGLLMGVLAALAFGTAGIVALRIPSWVQPRYAPTPFDDLLSKLPDRESAIHIGSATQVPKRYDTRAVAFRLRARLNSKSLSDALASDLRQDRMADVRGWLLPETLATLCTLAARAG